MVQVFSCAITGYGFARFSFKGKKLLFVIVIMMILVPTQVISLPLYSQFRYFGIKGLSPLNLIDTQADDVPACYYRKRHTFRSDDTDFPPVFPWYAQGT